MPVKFTLLSQSLVKTWQCEYKNKHNKDFPPQCFAQVVLYKSSHMLYSSVHMKMVMLKTWTDGMEHFLRTSKASQMLLITTLSSRLQQKWCQSLVLFVSAPSITEKTALKTWARTHQKRCTVSDPLLLPLDHPCRHENPLDRESLLGQSRARIRPWRPILPLFC